MKFYSIRDRKILKNASLTSLDKVIYEKCSSSGMNISRLIKAGKPYWTGSSKHFATTEEVISSVTKLQKLGLLEGR